MFIRNGFCCFKKAFEKLLQKCCPARRKQLAIPMPGGFRRGSLACTLFRQETVVGAAVEAMFEILAGKNICAPNCCKN